MNKEIKEKWLIALKSGKYIRGNGYLKKQEDGVVKHCCLGVLCDIYAIETGKAHWEIVEGHNEDATWRIIEGEDRSTAVLPSFVRAWADIEELFGITTKDTSLVSCNDRSIHEDYRDPIEMIKKYL